MLPPASGDPWAWLTICALATLFSLPHAAYPQTDADSEAVAADEALILEFVERLQSDVQGEREEAEAVLTDLGQGALPYLPEVTPQTSEELRLRLVRIRSAVAAKPDDRSDSPKRVASRITLSGSLKLSEALAALEKQTGNRVTDLRDQYGGDTGDPQLSVDFKQMAYWEALDTILDHAGLKLSPYTGEASSLGIINRDDGELPSKGFVAYCDVFRIEASRIEGFRELRLPNSQIMRMDLNVQWEPSQVPMTFAFDPSMISGRYDDGSPLQIHSQARQFAIPVQESVAGVDINLPFESPPQTATKIDSLKGQLTASLPGERRQLQFDGLKAGVTKPQETDSLTVNLERARRDGPIIDIVLSIAFKPGSEALSSYRGWVFQSPAVMLDAAGEEQEYVGLEMLFQREDTMAIAYKFEVGGPLKDLKLVFTAPSSVTTQQVDFELNGIELP